MLPDIIDGLDKLWGRAFNGPMHEFTFDSSGEFTGLQVERLMRRYGIRIWGRKINDPKQLGFSVKRSQAVWAEYILLRAGVPLTSKLLRPQAARREGMPKPWQKKGIRARSFVDHVVDILANIAG